MKYIKWLNIPNSIVVKRAPRIFEPQKIAKNSEKYYPLFTIFEF